MSYRYTSQTIRLFRGDAQPALLLQLFNESTGEPIDLTPYSTATEYPLLTLYAQGTAAVQFVEPLTVTDAEHGWCRLDWPTDLSELDPGQYGAQVQLVVDDGDTVVQTVDRHVKLLLLNPVGVS